MSIDSIYTGGMQSVRDLSSGLYGGSITSGSDIIKTAGGAGVSLLVARKDFLRFKEWKSSAGVVQAPMSVARGFTEYGKAVKAANGFMGSIMAGIKGIPQLAKSFWPAAKSSLFLSAVVSGATNLFDLVQGKIELGDALGNFVADTAIGTVGGVAGAALGGATTLLLGGLLGPTLLPIAAGIAGIAGFMGVDLLARSAGIRSAISGMFQQ